MTKCVFGMKTSKLKTIYTCYIALYITDLKDIPISLFLIVYATGRWKSFRLSYQASRLYYQPVL